MAYDVLDLFRTNFATLTQSLAKIESVKPTDWKTKLRAQLLAFFDGVHEKVDLIQKYQMKHLQAIIGSLSLETLSLEVRAL